MRLTGRCGEGITTGQAPSSHRQQEERTGDTICGFAFHARSSASAGESVASTCHIGGDAADERGELGRFRRPRIRCPGDDDARCPRRERANHRGDVLVAHGREDQRPRSPSSSRWTASASAPAALCAASSRADRPSGSVTRSRRPGQRTDASASMTAVAPTAQAARLELLEEPDGDDGVGRPGAGRRAPVPPRRSRALGVCSAKALSARRRYADRAERHVVHCPDERRAIVAARAMIASAASALHRADHDRHAGFDDAGLLRGDRREGCAEVLLMVERNRRDGARHGRQDVGRVETAAQSHFADRDVDAVPPEQLEGRRGRHLEERRVHLEDAARSAAVRRLRGRS